MVQLILLITMIFAIITAITVGGFTWWKMNQIRNQSIQRNFTDSHQNVWKNEKIGELLWDLKKQTKYPLQDEQLVYAINTIFRNNYQTTCVKGFNSDYEAQNLSIIAKQNINCIFFEFLLINFNNDIVDELEINIKLLDNRGMILIANTLKNSEIYKQIEQFCHQYKLRFDYEWIGKGIITIAK